MKKMIPITFNPQKILAYLQRHSPVNTFRLSRHLEINRGKLIDIIKDLTNEGLAKFEHGSVSIIEKSYQTQENSIPQKFTKERKLHNKVREARVSAKKSLAHKVKSFGLKKVRIKKKAKKVRTRKVLGKEKQEALNQWVRLANLDIEKLKIEIRLLSLSPNPEEMERLRDSITKLRDMINQKIREKLLISSSNYFQN